MRPRDASGVVAAMAFGPMLVLAAAGPAQAHAVLVATQPAAGSIVTVPVHQVVLTFDEPVQTQGAAITVTGPGQVRLDRASTLAFEGSNVSIALLPMTISGDYVVGYRVVSDDGHPVEATFSFTFRPTGGTGNPTVIPTSSAILPTDAPGTTSTTGGGLTAGEAALGGGAALAALGAATLVVMRRRRHASHR